MINVVHVSTYDYGGAGNAAIRLHLGLLELGINSVFLCAKKTTNFKNVVEFTQRKSIFKSQFIRTPFNAIGIPVDKYTRNLSMLDKLQGDYEIFTFPDSDSDILSHPLLVQADIINLHWVAKFLDYASFFKKVKKPIVWTLHDMNPIQGGFHYYDDVERNKNTFDFIENNLKKKKSALIGICQNLSVVAPSKWLHHLAIQNNAFKKASHFHIPYGLDTTLFKDYGKEVSRKVFNLPMDKIVISFVSSDIHTHRKGFDLLSEAILLMKKTDDVIFCAIGNAPQGIADNNLLYLGNIKDERLMSLLYSASDGYVLPSREDNFPNVMLESMACGTPVLSFRLGGMVDVIKPNFNGRLVNEISSKSLLEGLEMFINEIKTYDRRAIRKKMIDHYNTSVQANNYQKVYYDALRH